MICHANIKSGEPCKNKAKYGDYCGIHKNHMPLATKSKNNSICPYIYVNDMARFAGDTYDIHGKEYEYLVSCSLPLLCAIINARNGRVTVKLCEIVNINIKESRTIIHSTMTPDKKMSFGHSVTTTNINLSEPVMHEITELYQKIILL
jgi:hypothetical protein